MAAPVDGYVLEPAALVNIVLVLVRLMFELEPATTIDPVSLSADFAYTQPIKSTIVAAEMSTSPVEELSNVYSSVMAEPAPTIDQPLVVLSGRSLTWGE
jgi:hypothetical protein